MNKTYLLTGGNEGDRYFHMQQAMTNIELICGRVIQLSSLYETAPWGKSDQADFLNQVLLVETNLRPKQLLQSILEIEKALGRKRTIRNAPRTIDIDILLYDSEVIESDGLTIPHPRISERRFVLEPLNEIAADYIHPVLYKSVRQLLLECKDELTVKKIA
jgi:2-amino-4-hydroxy-6-hydroxymethyldihydropteridine diphosphokinase